MARKRMISPEIWESQDFAGLSLLARLLFIGLFSNADDEGRGNAKAVLLKSKIFPYDENIKVQDINKALDEIAARNSIIFYERNGNEYYSLTSWNTWQTINRPSTSKIPAYDKDTCSVIHGVFSECSVSTHGGLTPNRKEEKRKEVKLKEKETRAREAEMFSKFWDEYPRKVAKAKCEKVWEKLVTTEEMFNTIMQALRQQKKSAQWAKDGGQYIPHPLTWLNQRRWEDVLDPVAPMRGTFHTQERVNHDEIEAIMHSKFD